MSSQLRIYLWSSNLPPAIELTKLYLLDKFIQWITFRNYPNLSVQLLQDWIFRSFQDTVYSPPSFHLHAQTAVCTMAALAPACIHKWSCVQHGSSSAWANRATRACTHGKTGPMAAGREHQKSWSRDWRDAANPKLFK